MNNETIQKEYELNLIPDQIDRVAEWFDTTSKQQGPRRLGNKRLVYDKSTKTIVSVDSKGNKSLTPFTLTSQDADMI